MGAQPWSHFVPFQDSVDAALQALRQQEFEARRYHKGYKGPTMAPESIEQALERSGESGTRSVLDMIGGVSDTPNVSCVCPLNKTKLISFFGTDQPTHKLVEENTNFYDDIERGHGIYIVIFDGSKPSELFFAGYSFD